MLDSFCCGGEDVPRPPIDGVPHATSLNFIPTSPPAKSYCVVRWPAPLSLSIPQNKTTRIKLGGCHLFPTYILSDLISNIPTSVKVHLLPRRILLTFTFMFHIYYILFSTPPTLYPLKKRKYCHRASFKFFSSTGNILRTHSYVRRSDLFSPVLPLTLTVQ